MIWGVGKTLTIWEVYSFGWEKIPKLIFRAIRAHPDISHCSYLLLKCRVATNKSNWLKVQKWHICEKRCILISFWTFKHCFYYSFTLHYCAFDNFTLWMLIFSNSLDPDQARHFSGLSWGQTVCKGFQQTTKVAPSIYIITCWYYLLDKTFAKVNYIWLQFFPFG